MLATIEIRRARPYDCATFARSLIAAAADGLLDFEPDVTVETVEDAFREGSTDPDYDFFIAESEGRLVGALVGNPEVSRGVRSFGMWINVGARRQGAGRKLVAAALAARSGRTFEIEVWPDNEPAIKLYESIGFKPAGLLGERRQRRDETIGDVLRMCLGSGATVMAASD
jgi:putative acetyltransferase